MSKKALVTGSSSGIGRTIAIELAKNGYDVGFNYFSTHKEEAESACQEAAKYGGTHDVFYGDVSSVASIAHMFAAFIEKYRTIDLLVNNAGITKFQPFLEATEELWDKITNTDWKGSYFCTQQAARYMVEKGVKGSIINITSVHQELNFPHASVYGPSKAALNKFTQHAALELAPYGIRVNAIAPGSIKNDNSEAYTPRQQMFISRTPLQRMGVKEEIAGAVLFLSSDSAQYITGTTLAVDGGAMLPALLDNTYVAGREEPNL
ncbi:SDR family NAD(P)-dependent oxidoreductase [Paenibacillus nasutitermitis]|uniref:Oxidoreductase n=1 Tax=Paenibacillus nasutitermitis TaxID=1652958 RepID=A0A917E3S4_9BACL|nr:SDR family oxidoreductase [Paenibacillus nasutitermitis]GGE02132.1 oxidoreductase [Paenibacillus nasutitermitis]